MIEPFPQTLFVKIDSSDKDQPLLVAFEDMYGLAEHGETIHVATYELVAVHDVALVLDAKKISGSGES